MPKRALLTYSDYAALPDDGRRYELHRGELWAIPTPGTRHHRAIIALGSRLYDHVRARGLGEVLVAPTDCILSNVGVPYYWIVDPESHSVEAYTLTGAAYALA